jgi:hypothetical protein
MQHLERVIVSWDPSVSYPAGEFWQRYDAGEFR